MIDTEMLKILINKALERNKTIFQFGTSLESGKNFCEKLGCVIALKEEISKLKLKGINWEMVQKWREGGPKRAKGVTLERFETIPDEYVGEYCQIRSEILNQVPWGHLDFQLKETATTLRQREKRYKDQGVIWTTIISREKDGTISGFTETIYSPDQASILVQGYTGVKKQYRGRGLGKYLKSEMLTYTKENYSEVKSINTNFAVTNKPMIEINRRLGFKIISSAIAYKSQLNDLSQKLEM